MSNLAEKRFDYSILDPSTSSFLQQKEKNMREIVGNTATKLGAELKEAQNKLAQHGYGCFQEWYESLGFKKTTVYRLIHRHDLIVSNGEKQDLIEELPKSLVREIAKPSADPDLKQKVLNGDITSHKKYKQLKKEKEEAEKKLQQKDHTMKRLEKQLDEERKVKNNLKSKLTGAKKDKEMLKKEIKEARSEKVEVIPEEIQQELEDARVRLQDLEKQKEEVGNFETKKQKIEQEISELLEYKAQLESKNDELSKRAKISEGICGPIRKLQKQKGEIEELLKIEVEMDDYTLNELGIKADFLSDMASLIYEYIATHKMDSEVIDLE